MSSLYSDPNYDLTFDDLTSEFITTCLQDADPFYSNIGTNNGAAAHLTDTFHTSKQQLTSKFLDHVNHEDIRVLNNGGSNSDMNQPIPNDMVLSNQTVPKLKIKFVAGSISNQNGHVNENVNNDVNSKYSVVKENNLDETPASIQSKDDGVDLIKLKSLNETLNELSIESVLGMSEVDDVFEKAHETPTDLKVDQVDNETHRPAREKKPSLKFIESLVETLPDFQHVQVKTEPETPDNLKKKTPPKSITPRSRTNAKFDEDLLQPWPSLGEGWCRYEVLRKGGLSAGKSDVYYVGPDRKRVRSKPELQVMLGPSVDLTCFSYRKGEFMSTPQGRTSTKNDEDIAKRLKWTKPKVPALTGPLSMLHTSVPSMIPASTPAMIPASAPAMIPASAPAMIPVSAPAMIPVSAPPPIPSSAPALMASCAPAMIPECTPSMITSAVSTMISAIADSIKYPVPSSSPPPSSELVIIKEEFSQNKPTITAHSESLHPTLRGLEQMLQSFILPTTTNFNTPITTKNITKESDSYNHQEPDIPPNVTVTSSPIVAETVTISSSETKEVYRKKMMRCKECENCLRPNCGKCMYCLDMKKFGGNNSLRQTCIHRKCLNGLKVKIKLKRPRSNADILAPALHESVPTMINAPKRQKVTQYQDYESFKRHQQSRATGAGTPVLTSYSAILRSIENSEVPNIYMFPKEHQITIEINGISYPSTPLLWLDEIFHSQTIARTQLLTTLDEPPNWPEIMTRFYDFATRVFVTDHDIIVQTKVVDKTKYQITKITNYICVYGGGLKCPKVDVMFFDLLESVELYQYLPVERRKIIPVASDAPDNNVNVICSQLKDIVLSSPSMEASLKGLLVKFLDQNDLCKFILGVVNSNNLPVSIETQVVVILKTHLNLPGIESLTDLTGSAISQPPPLQPEAQEPSPSSSSTLLSETLACFSSGDKPLDERVKNYILRQPLQVIDLITELQKIKPLTLDNLSKIILDKMSIEARPKSSSSESNHSSNSSATKSTIVQNIDQRVPEGAKHPEVRQRPPHKTVFHHTVGPSTPANIEIPDNLTFVSYNNTFGGQEPNKCVPGVPGYNPRYFTPHLGPQHQQRYGRPPLKRSATPIGCVHHIAPTNPHTIHAKTVQIPSQIPNPPWGVPNISDLCKLPLRFENLSKSTQCMKDTKDFGQQANLSKENKAKEKFVDLNFCPHV